MSPQNVRVLVVDDSALARRSIMESLAIDSGIEVVGSAVDPYFAREKILALKPDVLTLDIEMPRMDGLTFLKLLMRHRPMPVVVLSSATTEGSRKAMEALQCGAVDVMGKPPGTSSGWLDGGVLAQKIRAAAQVKFEADPLSAEPARPPSPAPAPNSEADARALIVVGSSTGGTEALKTILARMPADSPPICVAQHIPARFSAGFANRLNSHCAVEVREAVHGDELMPGLALIAPGGKHLLVRWTGFRYFAVLSDSPPVNHQRPSVDVLFNSVVKAGGAGHAVAALLTGMGSDGADGLLSLRQGGAWTIAQSERTCVVFGMPRAAIERGAAKEILDLGDIGPELTRQGKRIRAAA